MTLAPAQEIQPRPHLFTRHDLLQMVEQGIIDPEARVELLDGEILDMGRMGPRHDRSIAWATGVLVRAFGPDWIVRVQLHLAIDDYNLPMPDFGLMRAEAFRTLADLPATLDLAIEVSDTTLSHDRNRKARTYARAGIREYWIVNLKARQLEVLRDPDPEAGVWRERFILDEDGVCRPLAHPATEIRGLDLLGIPPS